MRALRFRALGCQGGVCVEDAADARSLDWVLAWLARAEQVLSRFLRDSELSRLNRAGGSWVRASPMLFQAIEAACAAARESGGLVTPTVLDAVEEVGYRGSFTGPQIQARCADDTRCQPVPSWQAIELDEAALRVRLPRGTRLDLGGTAKGWLADRLCHTFRGPALVDLGGDIAVNGPRSDGSAWPIAIARVEPNEPEPPLLLLASGGVATSGRDYRVFARGHHLIDPRCGAAARTRVVSASAIAESALAAEVAAKVVLLADAEAGFPWVQKRLRVAARALFEGGRVVTSSRFLHHTWQDHDTAQTA